MDALADVLKTIRLKGTTYFCTDFSGPWGMDVKPQDEGLFHVVIEGQCWVITDRMEQPVLLKAGDIIAFPTGGAHSISDSLDTPKQRGQDIVRQIMSGTNPFQSKTGAEVMGNQVTLMCGYFKYDSSIDHPFIKGLPCYIHIKSDDTPDLAWLRTLVQTLSRESRLPQPGSSAVVDKLTEIFFIQLMRIYMNTVDGNLDYMVALSDPKIGPALNLIHADSNATWTVEKLSEQVAMVRTAFSERFSKLVGIPPKTYLTNWRMQKAKIMLEQESIPMVAVAESSGYSSESAFSKAFSAFFGVSPGKFRKQQ